MKFILIFCLVRQDLNFKSGPEWIQTAYSPSPRACQSTPSPPTVRQPLWHPSGFLRGAWSIKMGCRGLCTKTGSFYVFYLIYCQHSKFSFTLVLIIFQLILFRFWITAIKIISFLFQNYISYFEQFFHTGQTRHFPRVLLSDSTCSRHPSLIPDCTGNGSSPNH